MYNRRGSLVYPNEPWHWERSVFIFHFFFLFPSFFTIWQFWYYSYSTSLSLSVFFHFRSNFGFRNELYVHLIMDIFFFSFVVCFHCIENRNMLCCSNAFFFKIKMQFLFVGLIQKKKQFFFVFGQVLQCNCRRGKNKGKGKRQKEKLKWKTKRIIWNLLYPITTDIF